MNLHELTNNPGAKRSRMRVGRGQGSGKGTTAGRGTKGQKSRSGYSRKATFEGGQMPLVRRLPKRGFKNPGGTVYAPVNVAALSRFAEGGTITIQDLRAAGLANGPQAKIKILGHGDAPDRKLQVQAHAFSAAARAKIEAAGGTCEVVR
jgi:large subunit ribosomal protein L15